MDSVRGRLFDHGRALLMAFGCVTLANLEYVEHARPIPGSMITPATYVGVIVAAFIFLPTVMIYAADRVISLKWGERGLRWYRTVVLGLALFFIARELHLYNDSVSSVTGELASHWVGAWALGIAVLAVALRGAYRVQMPIAKFFQYMGAVAIVLVAISAWAMAPAGSPPDSYHTVVTLDSRESEKSVYVLVFDELSYAVLTDESGALERENFPNFAALADDGVWFDDASTNYYHTRFVIPSVLASMETLTDEYELWSYPQYAFVETLMWDGCGTSYTCRGPVHTVSANTGEAFSYYTDRWLHESFPNEVAGFAASPAKWLLGDMQNAPVTSDPSGLQLLTKKHFAAFIDDISAEESRGRAHLFHTMLPHFPFVYDREGNARSSSANTRFYGDPYNEATYENYHEQAKFADAMLGEFIARLKGEGLYEDAVIILTGDHGLRRIDSGVEGPIDVDPESVHVPLIIRAPGLEPAVSDVDYQHIDFGPTLADVLGRTEDDWSPGVSALASERPERDKVFYTSQGDTRYWRYVLQPDSGEWELVEAVEGPLSEFALAAARPLGSTTEPASTLPLDR